MRSTKTKLDTIYLWVNLKRQCFYLNYLKRLLPIILLFLTPNFSAYSQKNEFRLTYYSPHIETIDDLTYVSNVILKNHNMNLLYYRDVYKITDKTKLSLLLGFEYAWFKVNKTYKNDTLNYDFSDKNSDNCGLRVGVKYDYKVYNRQKYSVNLDASYSILARFPIESTVRYGRILNDTTIYGFGYTINDYEATALSHAIDLSLVYKRKISSKTTLNFGINLLMYLDTYRKIEYYNVTSFYQPITNPSYISYSYREIGFSVGVTF